MADDDQSYNDSHRAFLQAFMARGCMTFDDAKPILAAIFSVREDREILPNDISQSDLSQYVSAINIAISPFDLEIRSSSHQTSQTRVYALVNTTSDPFTQLATTYTADEIAYVKRLLDTMFDTNNTRREEAMVVSSMKAVQLAKVTSASRREGLQQQEGETRTTGAAQSLGLREAEDMLRKLVDEGWFEKTPKGNYTLSPRALMELRTWLVATYNDDEDDDDEQQSGTHPRAKGGKIKMCFACGDIITIGQRCPSRLCPVRLHDGCTRNFFRMQQSETCPVCKARWTGDNFVGEKAVTGTRISQGRARNSNAGGRSWQVDGTNDPEGSSDDAMG